MNEANQEQPIITEPIDNEILDFLNEVINRIPTNDIINENENNQDGNLEGNTPNGNHPCKENDITEKIITYDNNLHEANLTRDNVCKLQRNRRSGTIKNMSYESFGESIQERISKQVGFYTDTPLEWFNAIQKYACTYNVMNRLDLNKNKNGKFTICKIQICFNDSKHVLVSINFVTGIVNVKGVACYDWASQEFKKVKSYIDMRSITEDSNNVPPEESNNVPLEESANQSSQQLTDNDEKEVEKNIDNDENEVEKNIEQMWLKTNLLENCLKTLETSLLDLIIRMDQIETSSNDKNVQLDNKLKEREKRIDDKIMFFKKDIEEEVEKKLNSIVTKMDNKIESTRQVIGQFKIAMQKQLNEITALREREDESSDIETNLQGDMKTEGDKLPKSLTCPGETKDRSNHDQNSLHKSVYKEKENSVAAVDRKDPPFIDNNTEIIMCFDSNGRFINLRKLWTLKGTQVKSCGNLAEVNKIIDSNIKYTKLKYFFMNVGCNDLDNHNAEEVFRKIQNTSEKLKMLHPDLKIIVSEIIPRMDDKDDRVKETNLLLNKYVHTVGNIYVVHNYNLRDPDFFTDAKHLRENCIPRLAANIKRSLYKAYNLTPFKRNGGINNRDVENTNRVYNRDAGYLSNTKYHHDNERNQMESMKQELIRKLMAALV